MGWIPSLYPPYLLPRRFTCPLPESNPAFNSSSSLLESRSAHTRMSNWATAYVCFPLSTFVFCFCLFSRCALILVHFPYRERTQGRRDRPEKLRHHPPAHHQADHWPGELNTWICEEIGEDTDTFFYSIFHGDKNMFLKRWSFWEPYSALCCPPVLWSPE